VFSYELEIKCMVIRPGTIKPKKERPVLLKSIRLHMATPKIYIKSADEIKGGKIVWPAVVTNR